MLEIKNYINFIEEIINEDMRKGLPKKKLLFRFPPEPNGFLHLGHAKSICLNFRLAKKYKSFVNLRFDDTNPTKEKDIYINSIKKDISWLGLFWSKECYTSDLFNSLYKWALHFIQEGIAYIDEQSQYIILKQRKTPFSPGVNSPYRNRPKEESLVFLKKMKEGKILEGNGVLRAKINMKSSNMNLRDPIMFRILKVTHKRSKKIWNIYPLYDWAHGISDLIEKISHSLCSLEFNNHKPLYSGYLILMKKKEIPKQLEFSRLNLSNNFMSKRKLLLLIQEGIVEGWKDARLLTLSGLKNRGYNPYILKNFCYELGYSKRDNIIPISRLESNGREHLNKIAIRIMGVFTPIKLVIENYPLCKTEWIQLENNTESNKEGKKKISFSRYLYIEKVDFRVTFTKFFHRLTIGKKVRLKNAFIIKGSGYLKDSIGIILKISANYIYRNLSVKIGFTKKIKGTLHWVECTTSILLEIRLYEDIFFKKIPNTKNNFNINSLKIIHIYGESTISEVKKNEIFQFYRVGFFCVHKNNLSNVIIFNRTILNKSFY